MAPPIDPRTQGGCTGSFSLFVTASAYSKMTFFDTRSCAVKYLSLQREPGKGEN